MTLAIRRQRRAYLRGAGTSVQVPCAISAAMPMLSPGCKVKSRRKGGRVQGSWGWASTAETPLDGTRRASPIASVDGSDGETFGEQRIVRAQRESRFMRGPMPPYDRVRA